MLAEGESRQERVQRRLELMIRRPDFPAFSEHVRAVLTTLDEEERSAGHITSRIIRDYSLTLKVLNTANSLKYNRSGKPIQSITHAVALIGIEAVRSLTAGMLLFEHYRGVSPGLKELMLLSLLTANHAHLAALRLKYPRHEEAYLCGMYRNLGEIALGCYFPRDYAALLLLLKEKPLTERQAALRLLGFTLEDLGERVAAHWRMPPGVLQCLGPWEPRPAKGEGDLLRNITAFSHGLTTAIYRREAQNSRSSVKLLLDAYRPVLGLTEEDAQSLAGQAIEDTRDTFATLRVPLDDLRLRRHMEAALEVLSQAEVPSQAEDAPDQPAPGPPGARVFERLIDEVRSLAFNGAGLNEVLMTVLEGICRGGAFDRAAFCLVSPDRNEVAARLVLGEGSEDLLGKFRFPMRSFSSPVGVALGRRQDLYVDRERDGRFEAADMVRSLAPAGFGLLPVIVDGVGIGCLYFDRLADWADVDESKKRSLHALRDLAAAAIARRRTAVPA